MKLYSVCAQSVFRYTSLTFLLLFLHAFLWAQPVNEKPQNVKILREYQDNNGNKYRVLQYTKGSMLITETIIAPKTQLYIKRPIDPDTLDKDSVLVVVDKSHYAIRVFYRRALVRSYKAVFGPHPLQEKCMEGDRCTPEGWFHIASKNARSRYDKFLALSYPNDSDLVRFRRLKQRGVIPADAKIGGSVGIHGVWPGGDDMIDMGIGWTDGCVALKNKDVDDLYKFVTVGTRVYIKK